MKILHAAIVLLIAGTVSPAWAADCAPLRLLNSIRVEAIDDGNAYVVPAMIDEKPVKLLVDTGGGTTQITQEAAGALGLRIENGPQVNTDVYGNLSYRMVVAKTFDLGNQRGEKIKIQILPGQYVYGTDSTIAGVLATDLFLQNDLDLDFGSGLLNVFSQDHCEGKVAYWPQRPLAVIPMDLKDGHINIQATLDGHPVDAVISTGSDRSFLNANTAKQDFGIDLDSAPVKETASYDPRMKIYSHDFGELSLNGVGVSHPKIDIRTDQLTLPNLQPYWTFFHYPKTAKLIIGMNILKHLHLYVSNKEKRLYISPASAGDSPLLKPAASASP